MAGWLAAPVMAGLAIGVAFVLLFSFLLPTLANQQHGRIVFSGTMDVNDKHQIYIVNDDGTGLRRLTEDDDLWHFEPVSSPDGSKVAYIAYNSFPNAPPGGKLVENMYVMNADGSNKVLLADSSDGFIGRHIWSPDSTKIAYEAGEDIFVINADETGRIRLTSDSMKSIDLQPTWVSNNKILFASALRNGTEVLGSSWKEINIDGTGLKTLFDYDFDAEAIHDWSPDLSTISFIHVNNQSSASLYVMDADRTDPRKLGDSPPLAFADKAWSPDSRKIAFQNWGPDSREIYVIDVDDGSYRNLSNSATIDSFPIWSPDGKKIAFLRASDGYSAIYVMNADGTDQREVGRIVQSSLNVPLDWVRSK